VDGSIACTAGAPRLAWPSANLTVTISSLSTVYVQVPVRCFRQGTEYNPTADPVAMAFKAGWANPGSGDWNAASWDTGEYGVTYLAQCLVGPSGTVTLGVGTWSIWTKVTDDPEVPVMQPGLLVVT
jgi:hypothetical protein